MAKAHWAAACVAALALGCSPAESARAALVFTNTNNITVANRQVESGGDTSDNPNVVNGAVGAVLAYTAPDGGYRLDANYGPQRFDDNDVGVGVPSDGFYAVPNEDRLGFHFPAPTTPPVLVGSMAIYYGYGNRTDGSYVLEDGNGGATLGAWVISGTPGTTNDGVDSFWLTFNTPVYTSGLVLVATGIENGTPSFREVDFFAPVPEPSAALLVGLPLLGLASRRGPSKRLRSGHKV
jgi:hypothetical protein